MRVSIVHDNADTCGLFKSLIEAIGFTVAWTATTGAQAIIKCQSDLPDLVLVKLAMPDMSGTEIIRTIMQQTPTTVIAVSKSIKKYPAKVFEAMSVGALDAFNEPSSKDPESIVELKRKIGNVGKLHRSATIIPPAASARIQNDLPLVAIGASTGGPAALVKVLSKFSSKPDAVIVIIQHMDTQFSEGMANWIDEQIKMKVEIARANQKPESGVVYVAGTDDHLIIKANGCFDYIVEPEDYPYRPSVDVFFHSVVAHWPNRMIGVLLTGMGRDGSSGLLSFYNRGMLTIAQDKQSCAVFGMPKAAIALNAASKILSIDDIGDAIKDAL